MSEKIKKKAVKRNEKFNQVCVWPGTLVGAEKKDEFEIFMKENFSARVQYLEEFETNPNDDQIDTGGRNDVLFAVHEEDIHSFALARLSAGMRWIEDVLDNADKNDESEIYPSHLKDYRTW
jgi:hypothetical protein